jgi:uncharacterized protein (TIGR04255 family)
MAGIALPSFKKPPVSEVALAVQFNEIREFKTFHYGLYRQRVIQRFPLFEEQPPLQRWDEKEVLIPGSPQIGVMNIPLPPLRRCWFVEKDKNRLIQLDPEHFVYNWRKVTGKEIYPRYDNSIRNEFIEQWDATLAFFREQGFEKIVCNHWEITYVNHIDKGEGWNSLEDLNTIFNFWSGMGQREFVPNLETLNINSSWLFPGQNGRLRMSIQPAVRQSDRKETILIKLVARGWLDQGNSEDLLRGFDKGREWIVRTFADITTKMAHEMWGRIS